MYKREGYDILTYFADLGGILDLLHITCGALTGLFSAKLLSSALVSAVYRIQESSRKQVGQKQSGNDGPSRPKQEELSS